MAASTAPANTYAARRERLAQQLLGATGQVALRKKSSNLFRDRDRTSKPRLDVRGFNLIEWNAEGNFKQRVHTLQISA